MKLNSAIVLNVLFVGSFSFTANPNDPSKPRHKDPESFSECFDSPGHFGKCSLYGVGAGVGAGVAVAGTVAGLGLFYVASNLAIAATASVVSSVVATGSSAVASISAATGLSKTAVVGIGVAGTGISAAAESFVPAQQAAPQQPPVVRVSLVSETPPTPPVRSWAALQSSVNEALPTPGTAIVGTAVAFGTPFIGKLGYDCAGPVSKKLLGVDKSKVSEEERDRRQEAEIRVEMAKIGEQDIKNKRMIDFQIRRLEGNRFQVNSEEKE